VDHSDLVKDVIDQVVRPIIPNQYLNAKTRYLINPTGRFVIGRTTWSITSFTRSE